jgi:hypothetical protein
VSISGWTVAFEGQGAGSQDGIYISKDGKLTTIADKNTPIPGGTGNFASMLGDAVSGGVVAIEANNALSQAGIYEWQDGTLTKVIAFGDMLGGQTVSTLSLGPDGLDGSSIAFEVGFKNGGTAVYEATPASVPEPSAVALVLIGLTLTACATAAQRRQRPFA